MKVFITGATGFVGREIVLQAEARGHTLRLLTRKPANRALQHIPSISRAEIQFGDVLDSTSLRRAFGGIDAVIHLVGIISEVGRRTFANIHIEGTRNVVAAAQSAGVNRIIHMSALGTRPNASSRYHQSKWAAEEIVRQSGLDYTIFRPSLIYGPNDHFVNLFSTLARFSPVLPIIGRENAEFQPVAVAVVAQAFITALQEPRACNETFDLCGPERMTMRELLDQILAVTGRKRWKVHIPLLVARGQAALLELVCKRLLRKAPPLNRDQLIMLQEDNVGERNKAEEILGLNQGLFREGIGSYLRPQA
jgi:uncharacterized protein YbjT (DUF2867 family)